MYNFNYHQAKNVDEAAKLVDRRRGRQADGRRHDADPDPEAAPRQALRSRRSRQDRRPQRHQEGRQQHRHRRDDAAFRCRQFRCREERDPRPRRSRRPYRRSRPCATAARSAARSPTTIRRRIIRPRSLALDATIVTNKRKIAADDFFKGLFETALEPGEIITAVSFPIPEKSDYMKFPNPASRYAIVGVYVAKTGNNVRVAVTGAGPVRLPPEGHGSGADEELHAGCDQGHQAEAKRAQLRHPCERRISRPSRQRDGAPRGPRLRLIPATSRSERGRLARDALFVSPPSLRETPRATKQSRGRGRRPGLLRFARNDVLIL